MDNKFNKIKQDYLLKYGYFDKEYIDDKEQEEIKNLHRKERKNYIKINELYRENDNLSENVDKYYRVVYWDMDNEQLNKVIMMNTSRAVTEIDSKLSIILGIIIVSIILAFLTNR